MERRRDGLVHTTTNARGVRPSPSAVSPLVVALTRSTIKGTRRETVREAIVTPAGLAQDREFLLVEAGRALKTVANPALLGWASSWDGVRLCLDTTATSKERSAEAPAVQVWQPDPALRTITLWGRPLVVEVAPGAVARAASTALGRDVEIARARCDGRAIYDEPVSVLFASELDALPAGRRDARPFRMNVVIDDRGSPFSPHEGRLVRLGDVELRLTRPMVRCAVVDLEAGPGLLKEVPLRDGAPVLGWGATVVRPGRLRLGDRVR